MRTMERSKDERRIRVRLEEQPIEPPTLGRSATGAVVLAGIGLLGLVVLLAAVFFATVGLVDALVRTGLGPVGFTWGG
jgi:hypothetical protein